MLARAWLRVHLRLRIEDNGALYDREWGPALLYTLNEGDAWVELGRIDDVERPRSRTRAFAENWTRYYVELMDAYAADIGELIEKIEAYLGEGARPA